ncbi:MAG TPA: VIT domain-containing protein, partial [Planctomycetota bacterium]|nr:VIT domain-containing protein [Planctomycetota bacterium]
MKVRWLAILGLLWLTLCGAARADGFVIIIPPEPPPPWPRPVPPPPRPVFFPLAVKTHRVTASVADQVATTEVDEVFHNPNPVDLEGTYLFPLPEGAAVAKFSLFMNGKEVEAELLDAAKARAVYEGIVRQMRDPALLEYAGRGLVKARIYPIPARGDARVKIAYSQVLRADGGVVEYRYPLATEKWSAAPLEEARVEVTL